MAKKRRKKAARAAQRPNAPRSEAQIAAARENIAKAQAAKAEKQAAAAGTQASAHPADAGRPRAFFTLGERRQRGERANTGDPSAPSAKADNAPPKPLTLDEMRSLRDKLISLLVSLWELADKGLTATAFDGEECLIWRTIDDSDTAFLADRILAKGRENPYVGAQVRLLIDHWADARMVAILGPRLLDTAGWHQAHGLKVAAFGLDVAVPPRPRRRGRSSSTANAANNGHQAGTTAGGVYTTEAYPYGAQ